MSTWVPVVISTALAACSSRTVTERERALAQIPAPSHVIFAADGPALATPAFRRVIDSLSSHVPTTLACVIDVATTSDAIAIGVERDVGATVVLSTRATIYRCPALSQIDERTYVTTIGGGAPVSRGADSALASATWSRARPYLLREPVAIAAELPELRLVAVAQPEPIDAWLAIDALDSAAIERDIKAVLERWRAPATIELAGKLAVTRTGMQVKVDSEGLTETELITIIGDTLRALETPAPVVSPSATFTCPAQTGNGIVSCHDGNQYVVTSVEAIVRELATVKSAPVIAGGDIIGIRLLGEPRRLLQRDDIILGVDSHRITDATQLARLAPFLRGKAHIAVRRDGVEGVLELGE